MIDEALEVIVGTPVVIEELKRKPGRRRTLRARGPRGSAIAKLYDSDRAAVVATRIASLAAGPVEPVVPAVLHVDAERHLLVLADIPGQPLREALVSRDLATCWRVGSALGTWHAAWEGAVPGALTPHTAGREHEILRLRAETASPAVTYEVENALPRLAGEWECTTVVHRDLYEEQVLVGERVGLIDVDDAALGPPELDVGNLLAHVELLQLRRKCDLAGGTRALLEGYAETGPMLSSALLGCCRSLTLLRLACLNDDVRLVEAALSGGVLA